MRYSGPAKQERKRGHEERFRRIQDASGSGFTDFARVMHDTYTGTCIPNVIAPAAEMNTPAKKKIIRTTGSWILEEVLENGPRTAGKRAGARRYCAACAAFYHTYGVAGHRYHGIRAFHCAAAGRTVRKEDHRSKDTDVHGHTKALVRLLHSHGVRLLHIGVSGSSAMAMAPPCFLWKDGDAKAVAIYSGDYGGAFGCDWIDDILCFDHTLDNRGTSSAAKIEAKLQAIGEQYHGYEVTAGTMDDIAGALWQQREKLPVVTEEPGDTWIHGSAADPYKSAALRERMALKRKWLAQGSMRRESGEYVGFTDALLCIAEHTCGTDMKTPLPITKITGSPISRRRARGMTQ